MRKRWLVVAAAAGAAASATTIPAIEPTAAAFQVPQLIDTCL